jgi:hypothetical protein
VHDTALPDREQFDGNAPADVASANPHNTNTPINSSHQRLIPDRRSSHMKASHAKLRPALDTSLSPDST